MSYFYDIGENSRNTDTLAIRILIPIDESPFLPEKKAGFFISLLMYTNSYEIQYGVILNIT